MGKRAFRNCGRSTAWMLLSSSGTRSFREISHPNRYYKNSVFGPKYRVCPKR